MVMTTGTRAGTRARAGAGAEGVSRNHRFDAGTSIL